MIPNNTYPVKYKDFLRIKSTGNYVIQYAILNDRVHFEMAIENAVFITQRFIHDIKADIEQKAPNYNNDPIEMFLKMSLTGNTFYRYYPTDQMKNEMRKIKLYDKIIIREAKHGSYNKDDIKILESDTFMKAMDGEEVILFGDKE